MDVWKRGGYWLRVTLPLPSNQPRSESIWLPLGDSSPLQPERCPVSHRRVSKLHFTSCTHRVELWLGIFKPISAPALLKSQKLWYSFVFVDTTRHKRSNEDVKLDETVTFQGFLSHRCHISCRAGCGFETRQIQMIGF